jgi:hypothetical protein
VKIFLDCLKIQTLSRSRKKQIVSTSEDEGSVESIGGGSVREEDPAGERSPVDKRSL